MADSFSLDLANRKSRLQHHIKALATPQIGILFVNLHSQTGRSKYRVTETAKSLSCLCNPDVNFTHHSTMCLHRCLTSPSVKIPSDIHAKVNWCPIPQHELKLSQYHAYVLTDSDCPFLIRFIMNHDSGFIIGIAMIFCQNSNRTYIGSANRKIDIFKITCKVLLCVEVGLIIRKHLSWNQTLCIPYSANLKLLYQTSCISARWSASSANHHIWHTGTWLRGDHSGKCCSISCNSVVLQVTNC